MAQENKTPLCLNFQTALFYLQHEYTKAYYNDSFFNDVVQMNVNDGINLIVPTYSLTKSINDCLSDAVYWYLKNKFSFKKNVSYVDVRDILISEGSIEETGFFTVKLRDLDLKFNYYRSSGGCYIHESDLVKDVPLNSISDDMLMGKVECLCNNSTFNSGIGYAYQRKMEDSFKEYDRSDLLFHLIDSIIELAYTKYEKEVEETKIYLREHKTLISTGKSKFYKVPVRDEFGNTLYCV